MYKLIREMSIDLHTTPTVVERKHLPEERGKFKTEGHGTSGGYNFERSGVRLKTVWCAPYGTGCATGNVRRPRRC